LKKIWKIKEVSQGNGLIRNPEISAFVTEMKDLKAKVQLPELVLKLLFQRGVNNYQRVVKFFKPVYEKAYDPLLMKDCDIASERILEVIKKRERIMILGDYDVDGICGVSMFYLFLKNFDVDSNIYIPNRIEEGYGISEQAIDVAEKENIKLILSIDCGITAAEKVEYAKSKGIDFIICDHHRPPENIPDAFAVLNPLRLDCNYPFKYLCGTGVAFKLIQAICNKLNHSKFAKSLLDFVAIATSSDIVTITDENRIFVSEGLKQINEEPRASIRTLILSSNLNIGFVNTTNIVFSIAPRINAVGRLGDAKRAVELLTSENPQEQEVLADKLNEENDNRRDMDKAITEEAYLKCDEFYPGDDNYIIVLHNENWHSGVIGIVAARIVEKYNKPAIILTTVKGVAKGSARSINGFNIYEALKKCEDKLIQFGGHYHAAGLEIEIPKIEEFRKEINEIAKEEILKAKLEPEIEVDSEINFEEITPKFKKILSFFEPFGPGNMTPLFVSYGVQIVGDTKYFEKGDTLLFKLRQDLEGKVLDAVFFSSRDFKEKLTRGSYCDICFTIEKSRWNNMENYKLKIKDLRILE
jgi:single-stranded-DNA-specific exonuclease